MDKAFLYPKLAALLTERGLVRVHPDAPQASARAALEGLAGLPAYEQLWLGDLQQAVQIVAVASGERLTGVELSRRAQLLAERARGLEERLKGEVQVLQIAAYDRPVPAQEREFILGKARVLPFWPLARGRVASWIFALAEPALHATRFRSWPEELAAEELRALLQ